MAYELIAAVDLGSNSFRLQVGRIVANQIYPLDGLKESVRLAAGLTSDKKLDAAAQRRGIDALSRFGERLRDFDPGAVRAVATNTLRVAKNADQFLEAAEAALGFPIEVIAGREEARLIYLGVAHTLANPQTRQLVVDIGGGSTEFIIGQDIKPIRLESLYMGCVSFSLRFFPDGRVDKRSFREAELAARRELQTIVHVYRQTGWDEAIGSSGTAKAIVDLLEMNGWSDHGLTRDGLEKLRNELIHAGEASRMKLQGLRADRMPVLPGGLAIMSAIFKEFGLERMAFSEGALRLGVLYDQLGRYHHEDLREATVTRFMQRYEVDQRQAARVARTALDLLHQMVPTSRAADHPDALFLLWAANLHEVGISVAHSSYHKHSAYILANADMPGFSRRDQARLSRLVLAHRGKLERAQPLRGEAPEWTLIFCLRTAVMLHRARDDQPLPPLSAGFTRNGFHLSLGADGLNVLPLTTAALADEAQQWAGIGGDLRIDRLP
ncbi:MAG: exopolyphosphatase [Sulfuritalea sp.]|jgi:exopolyphosphatase/guanosine-5'-triphosphate,3'-diphosphate pyrophosphatase|nr:exopolyphosphatase [Sulfuritalea sp.]